MKRKHRLAVAGVVLVLFVSVYSHANPVIYLDADFDDVSVSSYGWGYAAQITEANLNAGTSVGSWTAHSSQIMADNSRKKQILADGGTNGPNKALRFGTSLEGAVGPNNPILSVDLSETLSFGNTISFSFDVVCHDIGVDGRAAYLTGLDSSGNRAFQLHIELVKTPAYGGQLGYVNQGGSQVMLGAKDDLVGYSTSGHVYDPADMKTVTISINSDSYGISLEGASWSTNGIAFRDASASDLARIDFAVENSLWTGTQYDNLLVTQEPVVEETTTVLLFDDDFANDVVTDSKHDDLFWNVITNSNAGDANAAIESGGALTLTAGDDDGSNENNYSGVDIYSTLSSHFSFFSQAKTYKVRGITFDDHGTGIDNAKQKLRFCLHSDGYTSYAATNAVVVVVKPDGSIRLGAKEGEPVTNAEGTLVDSISSLGASGTYGFDLTISPIDASSQSYTLKAYIGSTPVLAGTETGTLSLAENNWGNGETRLSILAQEGNVTGGSQYFDATVSHLQIYSVEAGDNLLYNYGFEKGDLTGWHLFGGTPAIETTTVYAGDYACRISGRTATWHSIRRYIDGVMTRGETYTVSVYGRLGSGADQTVQLKVVVDDSAGTHTTTIGSVTLSNDSWTRMDGLCRFQYTGTLNKAYFYVSGVSAGVDLLLDDARVQALQGTVFYFH